MSDNKLRGMKIPLPRYNLEELPEDLKHVKGYSHLQTFFPSLSKLFRINKYQANKITLDVPFKIIQIESKGEQGICQLKLQNKDGETKTISAFCKVTHLLDPIRWMQGKYSLPKEAGLPGHSKTWVSAWHKLQDVHNQAYVQTLAMYALSKLRESNISPHFNLFFGAYCAKAENYRFSLNDDYPSFRNTRWFWGGSEKGLYSLEVVNTEHPELPVPQEVLDELLQKPEYEEEEEEGGENESVEELHENLEGVKMEEGDLESLHSASLDSRDFEDDEDDDEESISDNYTLFAKIPNFPVMLLFTECNENTMDSLLDEDIHDVKPGSEEWELMWSAWIFQIIAATNVMQKVLGMTHNDLHTNNILWSKTDKEFLYYKSKNGTVWKVPTYGKIFHLIDFGRAIFTVNNTLFISDDFKKGNDADGQYKFHPLTHKVKDSEGEVPPNASFDLSRLAVSLFEALFPEKPEDHPSGRILSEEEGLVVRESVSPLYNCLWSWMVDDEDRNILMESDGTERFPDFDLYNHIAAHIHNAVPEEQVHKEAFARFITKEDINETAYPLYCD